jgi:hypothetical protein
VPQRPEDREPHALRGAGGRIPRALQLSLRGRMVRAMNEQPKNEQQQDNPRVISANDVQQKNGGVSIKRAILVDFGILVDAEL